MNKRARIRGEVHYREGDGPQMPIRTGPIEIVETPQDVTIAWVDGKTRSSAAIPQADFQRYVDTGAIEVFD
jgi:hypothetical protein